MAVCPFGNSLAVSRPQIPQHQVRSFGGRKIGKAIDFAVLANPVSCVDVIGMHLFGKPGAEGLFRCEEALCDWAIS